jgi:hypothetical protein
MFRGTKNMFCFANLARNEVLEEITMFISSQ